MDALSFIPSQPSHADHEDLAAYVLDATFPGDIWNEVVLPGKNNPLILWAHAGEGAHGRLLRHRHAGWFCSVAVLSELNPSS